jgi:hypothetical protein
VHVRDGAGAGRWPTSEAVFADLLAVARFVGSRAREGSRLAAREASEARTERFGAPGPVEVNHVG